ncbi:MFS transporter [Streptomyces sp. NBC_00257]|uniref:MFS transporter n=1 Tax=Streptomyces sanglieri TaxID=193460 RepID=A0ABW2WUC5_9ACTN|nr:MULTISPECIES: MFS transporter [unclassified Streptomyces]WTB57390.1 MFS transporter [Streptomyces sp. NBC_00826]WTH89728.1 MFS transporter [Streptomyces sp. NBC_00825]WTH98455.1 MFS transporter [Streptomyces sp. NBC_00822]MCX4393094.1 MFS transporter [Streptomyces sp. NBC_01767]MCX4863826.1 MFS transporter [Streptomyces sp. NBC_00906]
MSGVSGVNDQFRRAQLAIAALFCFLGFQYATWASRLPAIKTRLDLTEAELGLLLMACGAGAAASFPLVAILMKRMGSRRLAVLSAVALSLLLLALSAAPNYPVALVVICCDGIAVGALNVAMNAQGAALEVTYQRTAMARLHATFSAGSLFAALLASGVNLLTTDVTVHFGVAAALLLLLIGLTRSGLLTEDEQPQAGSTAESQAGTPTEDPVPEKSRRRLSMPSRVTIWMGFAMVFGTVTEGAMNDWSALYMKDVVDAAAELAPLGIAVVSVMMVLARVFADGWRSRWGDGRIVRVGGVVAGTGLALALLAGGVVPTLIGFACVGLGVAAVTPCIYVAAAAQGTDALALVAAMGTTGLLAGPALIGFIASAGSLVWGMGAVAASAILVSLCATRIRWPGLAESEPRVLSPES